MALKAPRKAVTPKLSLKEERSRWRLVVDPLIWIVSTLVVVALLSQWLGWPLLGPYRPFVRALKADSAVEAHLQEVQDARTLADQIEKKDHALQEGLTREIATLREENLHLKEELLGLKRLKGLATTPTPKSDGSR